MSIRSSKIFKGKRGYFRKEAEVSNDIDKLQGRSDMLIESWKDQCSQTGITLSYESRSKRIRWRATVTHFDHQKYLTFESVEIQTILGNLADDAKALLIGYEYRRLVINMELIISRSTHQELKRFIERSRYLESIAPEYIKTPLTSA